MLLTFSDLHRPGVSGSGPCRGSKIERHHLDFVVDGLSLYEATDARRYDFVGLLGWSSREVDFESVQSLLLQRATMLPGDRHGLFVCAECGDIGCGAITAQISRTSDSFVWSDFAYENNYDPEMTNRSSYSSLGPFMFDATHYEAALRGVIQEGGVS